MTTIGWRTSFLVIAGLTLVAAALIYALIRDPETTLSETQTAVAQPWYRDLLDIGRLRALWPIFPIAAVSYAVVVAERGLWIGPHFTEMHNLAPIPRGDAVLVMAVAMSLGALAYGPPGPVARQTQMGWFDRDGRNRGAVACCKPLADSATGDHHARRNWCHWPDLRCGHGTRPRVPSGTSDGPRHYADELPVYRRGRRRSANLRSRHGSARQSGTPVAETDAVLHAGFGIALLAVASIYLLSTARPPRKR